MIYKIFENQDTKLLRSEDYNYNFSKTTGYFQRWGKTQQDDPQYSPFGPEILDLEISVNGCPNNCPYCYKNNSSASPTNMDFATFKTIIDKFNRSITQCALGITGVQTNPDFLRMMKYSREKGIIPNFTLSGIDLTDRLSKKIAEVSGALAVSAYESDKNICYNTVKKFTDLGMKQVNIHLVVSSETLPFVREVLHDIIHDPRLINLNAIVFLGLKPKGRAKAHHHPATISDYDSLIQLCQTLGINYGFDSCSAPKFEHAVCAMEGLTSKEKSNLIMHSESCESGLFSAYINVEGRFFPCSFTENEKGWEAGLDVVSAKSFLDIWNHERVVDWRNNLIKHNRQCPTFPQINS